MAFTVNELAHPAGDAVFYEPGFRTVIETHLPLLRNSPDTRRQEISADKIHQYEGDFYGLLAEQGVPLELHWLHLRVNGFESPYQFGRVDAYGQFTELAFTLLLPSPDVIRGLRTLYLTRTG